MLGSIQTNLTQVVQGHDTLYLGITVGTDSEMSPRVQLGSVPFSVWSLSVADDSITAAKIAAGAVGSSEIADGAVETVDIADGAVTQAKAPFAAEAYWGIGSIITQPANMKMLSITHVVTLQGGQPSENVSYDVSALGFSERPDAICQVTNGDSAHEFCQVDWDNSTNSTLQLVIRRYDGGNISPGNVRFVIILFGH
ncbi:hypothetical protein D6833_08780 [Candidatus Parcubacteria bacterium]|nr:MAG: hypothetical protein D6833_08780 [Candidatus Parcubacteria bacterium]